MDMIVFSWHVSKKDTRGSENKNYEEEALPDEHVAYHRSIAWGSTPRLVSIEMRAGVWVLVRYQKCKLEKI